MPPPVVDLGFAKLDIERLSRQGFPEVVFGEGKTPEQIEPIVTALVKAHGFAIATRLDPDAAQRIKRRLARARVSSVWHGQARILEAGKRPVRNPPESGLVAVVTAGTSDIPVAEEAVVTCEALGHRIDRVYDVGVAGLHRLLSVVNRLRAADVVIVAAGMEGALPSVVGGLVAKPVIAVPTSVGYGASLRGLAALLGMLNSCASGLTVVNIDNGFGAAAAARRILMIRDSASKMT